MCRKNTESKNPNVAKTRNGRKMFLSKSAVRDSQNQKKQEASGLLSILGIKIPLVRIPLAGSLLL